MSSQYDFENEVNSLMKLDAPIRSGPTPRWRRKALELPNCNTSANSSSLLSPLKLSNSSINKSVTKSPSRGHGSAKCKTPGASSKTPNRSFNGNKTPSRGDRYIPNRQAMNMELGQYKLSSAQNETNDEENGSMAEVEYKKVLKENVMQEMNVNDEKILAFKEKPASAEGHQNGTKVLYSSTKKNPQNKKKKRYIPSQSERILDAPCLMNDFYLNLLDWSMTDVLAVALADGVYLFNTTTGDIQLLLTLENMSDYVCSLRWVPNGKHIAVGTSDAKVQLWDVTAGKRLRNMAGHAGRVGSLCWNDAILTSGARDGHLHFHDVRIANHLVQAIEGHAQEVCGLEWSPDKKLLASGGNDNIVNIWDGRAGQAMYSFSEHQAAVKALAWCPWQPNLLATGGGSADRHIKFWNSYTGTMINSVDTKSQVCAIKWSAYHKELISSHGYAQNQLTIWSYPSMTRVQDLLGHTARVLYLAMSPDGRTVCSGAADETLRMWQCFAVDEKTKKLENPKAARSFSRIASGNYIR